MPDLPRSPLELASPCVWTSTTLVGPPRPPYDAPLTPPELATPRARTFTTLAGPPRPPYDAPPPPRGTIAASVLDLHRPSSDLRCLHRTFHPRVRHAPLSWRTPAHGGPAATTCRTCCSHRQTCASPTSDSHSRWSCRSRRRTSATLAGPQSRCGRRKWSARGI